MKARIIISLLAMTLLWSCATTMEHTWKKESFEGKKFEKILVLAISKNLKSRTLYENTMVDMLKQEGINATNALNVFTPVENLKDITEADIEKRIKDGGYDGVLVTTLIDTRTRDVQVNNNSYYPYMYGGYYGYGYRSFIYSNYNYMYSDQYREEKTYVLETRLYDVNISDPKQAVVWAGQSELVDPSSSESSSKTYSKQLVKALLDSGAIIK
ncbi:hypothetical protein [Maribellus sediminis]|uniref:hypothetical protein n=1 Tax=Maribellus sediminis TaxID=2696285 RepID=UPI00143145D9|nr:hypothetical protein [Maribellus sediminis]